MVEGSIYVGNKYSDGSNQYKYGHPHLFPSAAAFDGKNNIADSKQVDVCNIHTYTYLNLYISIYRPISS